MSFNLKSQPSILSKSLFALLASLGILALSGKAEAAEKVVLKYRFLRETISVAELTTFAETGELSSSLQSYLNMANREPEELRFALTQKVPVPPILLSRALNSSPGELLLDQVSEVIHTPTDRASRQSLRSALVKSALPDKNITMLEILENYPTIEVHVEGDRLADAYGKVRRLTELVPVPNVGDILDRIPGI